MFSSSNCREKHARLPACMHVLFPGMIFAFDEKTHPRAKYPPAAVLVRSSSPKRGLPRFNLTTLIGSFGLPAEFTCGKMGHSKGGKTRFKNFAREFAYGSNWCALTQTLISTCKCKYTHINAHGGASKKTENTKNKEYTRQTSVKTEQPWTSRRLPNFTIRSCC
jgi:hypothetical protein